MRIIYKEYQKIDERPRLILLVFSVLFACLLILSDYLNFHLHILIVVSALLVSLIYILTITFKFSTVIYSERIYLTFWPFFKTSINISEITDIKIISYNTPGFGVRYDIRNRVTYYKASGNTGLSITLVNHKTVVIGTRRATEIKKHLEQLIITAPLAPN